MPGQSSVVRPCNLSIADRTCSSNHRVPREEHLIGNVGDRPIHWQLTARRFACKWNASNANNHDTFSSSVPLCPACRLSETPRWPTPFAPAQSGQSRDGQYQDHDRAHMTMKLTRLSSSIILLAPINALSRSLLHAQVLVAATFPDQLQDATDFVGRYGPGNPGIDSQPWDVSIRAVAHYPAVLNADE